MLDKAEAFKILGLTDKSLHSDVETRYATLVKRYRAEQDNEKLGEVSLAYNIVTGRHVEPVEEDPRMQNVIWGKTRKEWSNIWLYGKFKFSVILIVSAFVIYMVYTIATNKPGDFKLAAVGELFLNDYNITENYVKSLFPEFEKVEISTAYLSETGGAEFGGANIQKAMILVTVSGEDIIILDRASFSRYAGMGAFYELGELYQEIIDMPQTDGLSVKPKEMTAAVINSDETKGEEKVYGIDVSDTQLLSAIGISGREQIITVSVKSKRPEVAWDFIRKLFMDTNNLLPLITMIPPPTPTPVPTPIPTPTIAP